MHCTKYWTANISEYVNKLTAEERIQEWERHR